MNESELGIGQVQDPQQDPQPRPQRVERITPEDIQPVIPEDDGSVFVLGINASDRQNRKLDPDSPHFGELDPGQAELTEAQYKDFFDGIFKELPPEERAKVDILVVASNSTLRMPGGINNPHKRSVETAQYILAGAKASMAEYGVNPSQLLNKTGEPIELTSGRLVDLEMLTKSPGFVQFLYEKYGDTPEFWIAYEEDRHKDVREQMGAEGPNEIADRVSDYMATLSHAIQTYHLSHPGRRVIAIVNMQYDAAAPMIKKYVLQQPLKDFVQIEKRGGIVVEVNPDGKMSAKIGSGDDEYPVSFSKRGTGDEVLRQEQDFLERYFDAHPSERITPEEMLTRLKEHPLDRKEVETVVDRFLEKHVQHKHGEIVFVGSGSGKSTTVRNQTPHPDGKTDLVDADFVYRETGAHPLLDTKPGEPLRTYPWWYMGDEVIAEVEKRCSLVNEVMVEKGLWALTSSFDPDDAYVPDNIVITVLPWREHLSHIHQKFDKNRGRKHYDGGVRTTYDGLRIAQSHREVVDKIAKQFNIKVVSSIDDAIAILHERERV